MHKKFVLLIIILCIIVGIIIPLQARATRNEYSSLGRVRIYSIDGDNISTSHIGSRIGPFDRIYAGDRLSYEQVIITGEETFATILTTVGVRAYMGENSLLQMPIREAEPIFYILKGNYALFNDGGANAIINIGGIGLKPSNAYMGTSNIQPFHIENTILLGYADILVLNEDEEEESVRIYAGHTSRMDEDIRSRQQVYTAITPLNLHTVSLFTLQTIYVHQEYLINHGGIVADLILEVMETEGGLTALLEIREAEEASQDVILELLDIFDNNNYNTSIVLPWIIRPDRPIPTPLITSPAALTIPS